MSVRVTSWVWTHSRARGTSLLVLLAISDSTEDDGSNAWPSVAHLAAKCRLSERTVQESIARLESLGELIVERQAGGPPGLRVDRRPNRYRVIMPGADLAPGAVDGVQITTPRGAKSRAHGVRSPAPYPSLETSKRLKTLGAAPSAPPGGVSDSLSLEARGKTLAVACGLTERELTSSARSQLRRAAKELLAVGATEEDILGRSAEYRRRWPKARLTPRALAAHWPSLAPVIPAGDEPVGFAETRVREVV